MSRPILFIILGLGTLGAGLARAEDACLTPMSLWQPREAVAAAAAAQGWQVRRIRTDDGCYKVYATDAQGREIEAEFDPATLALLELEYEDMTPGASDEDDNAHDGAADDESGPQDVGPQDIGHLGDDADQDQGETDD